jgi:hypothetical protein
LERKFRVEREKSIAVARGLGHRVFWVHDEPTEGAIGCDDCGLWGRVILQPLADRGRTPNEITGSVLTATCSVDAVSRIHGDEALRMRQFSDTINLPAMFADIGHEPKEVRNEELIPKRTRYKKGKTWSFNGRRKGGES